MSAFTTISVLADASVSNNTTFPARHSLTFSCAMPPGIFRLRTACCTLVVPVRLAICLPLLICTLDAYSPHAALLPQGALPLILNGTHELPASGDGRTVPVYVAMLPVPPPAQTGRVLTLAFVIAAAALSVLGMLALWWSGDPAIGDADDATLVEGERTRRSLLGPLLLGTATRLLLGALGTTAMVRVIGERAAIKRGSFIAIEVLGWLLVAVLYCGAFHRIHCLLCGSGALQGGRKEALQEEPVKEARWDYGDGV
ncbi:hypothetical protein BJY52DRAFT_1290446 [Lactarius psammicola]|nr:hypothetical protein BJY52DRAFT_1290446 [Lactarius psammicola]